jgi:hypothetical protein
MWIRWSGRQMDNYETLSSGTFTGCGGWCSGQRWCRLWSLLFASVGQRCSCSFASPVCLQIICWAVLATKTSGSIVLTMRHHVLVSPSIHLRMPRKLDTPLLFLIRYCISCISACENSLLAILATFLGRSMSDCSSCTCPSCLAIVADMFNTYTKFVAASDNQIWLLPQPSTLS